MSRLLKFAFASGLLLLALVLFLSVTRSSAGPLGIDLNSDTPRSLRCFPPEGADPSTGTFYACSASAIPQPIPDFQIYSLIWRADVGICSASALSRPTLADLKERYSGKLTLSDIQTSSDMLAMRYVEDLAEEYSDLLTQKYGPASSRDGYPLWRGEADGVSFTVKMIASNLLSLYYEFDEKGRNCNGSETEKGSEAEKLDSL